MRLVCLHADTVDALKRLNIQFDDLTPAGLWSSKYHLVGLTPEQFEALEVFQVQAEDITPAQLALAANDRPRAAASPAAAGGQRPTLAAPPETPVPDADAVGREPARMAAGADAEVPLTQTRDGGSKGGEAKADTKSETKPDGKTTTQGAPQPPLQNLAAPSATAQQAGQKGAGTGKGGGPQAAPPAQGARKGQPVQGQGGGQRYGTTRLRISVAGKYTEATVANGKIVVAGRSFDTPDQAAAELTKSRGDWTFWEYYDSADGKWRMLTRDWDTVLKSAAPGGR